MHCALLFLLWFSRERCLYRFFKAWGIISIESTAADGQHRAECILVKTGFLNFSTKDRVWSMVGVWTELISEQLLTRNQKSTSISWSVCSREWKQLLGSYRGCAVLSDGNLTYGRPVVSIRKTDAEGPLQDISLGRLVVIFRRGVENRIPVFPSTASLRDINTNG